MRLNGVTKYLNSLYLVWNIISYLSSFCNIKAVKYINKVEFCVVTRLT